MIHDNPIYSPMPLFRKCKGCDKIFDANRSKGDYKEVCFKCEK